jgi:hypothetical protein
MGDIVKLVTEVGSFGLLLALAGFIIYKHFKDSGITNMSEFKKLFDENTKSIKDEIKLIDKKVDNLEKRLDYTETRIYNNKTSHTKQFLDRLKLGPKLHKTLNTFRTRVNADHIFIGSFHNGNESITGIPYYKFDIIAERFRPDKVEDDIEFGSIYKDNDLLRHDLLPSEVVQRGTVHYIIDKDDNSELENIDDILYRRMIGRGIKQIAICLLRDPSGTPSGFVGCIRFDYEEMDIRELMDCGRELEADYAANEKLINNK